MTALRRALLGSILPLVATSCGNADAARVRHHEISTSIHGVAGGDDPLATIYIEDGAPNDAGYRVFVESLMFGGTIGNDDEPTECVFYIQRGMASSLTDDSDQLDPVAHERTRVKHCHKGKPLFLAFRRGISIWGEVDDSTSSNDGPYVFKVTKFRAPRGTINPEGDLDLAARTSAE